MKTVRHKTKTMTAAPSSGSLWVVLSYFGALLGLFLASGVLFAADQGLGDVAKTVTGNLKNVATLISAAAYVAGIGFALSGMMKFKAHKDQPQQVPLSQPIVLLLIAAGLVFLPSIIQTAGQTLFEGGGEAGKADGTGLKDL